MKKTNSIALTFCLLIFNIVYCQTRLVLNGGFINITNSAKLIIDNPATNAITRNSGQILSEAENNIVKWNTGATTGTYIIPWGYSNTDYIPLQFTISTAGTANGNILFSTYRTATWQNSTNLPTGVTNANNQGGGDASAYVADRFWSIDASSYTLKPTLTNLTFTYVDGAVAEIKGGNTINEANLQAQRWNSTINDWEFPWIFGTDNPVTNTVVVNTVAPTDLYKWWTLVDFSSPLPIELIQFYGICDKNKIILKWATASETNNNFFSVEKSDDGNLWRVIKIIPGAGNSATLLNYSLMDDSLYSKTNYYRLKQTDYNGNNSYSAIIFVTGCQNNSNFSLYPNPTSNEFTIDVTADATANVVVEVYDVLGKQIISKQVTLNSGVTSVKTNIEQFTNGMYFVRLVDGDNNVVYTQREIKE